jgi:hypothetical protein
MNKRLFEYTVIVAMCCALLLVGMSVARAGEPAGLVGRWEFDDGTGKDLSGNGNDAQFGNAEVYSLGNGKSCVMLMPDTGPVKIPVLMPTSPSPIRPTGCEWRVCLRSEPGRYPESCRAA